MTSSKALVVLGYCLPALASGLLLSSLSFAGDVASALVFTIAQALLVRSARWTAVSAVGFLVGWSVAIGAAALAGIGAVLVYNLVTAAALRDSDLPLVAFPAAGLVGGAVAGAIAGSLQLAGDRRLPPWRWLARNSAGSALADISLLYAFTIHAGSLATTGVLLACAAGGVVWGLLVAGVWNEGQ